MPYVKNLECVYSKYKNLNLKVEFKVKREVEQQSVFML